MSMKILQLNPCLEPYEADLKLRMSRYRKTKRALLGPNKKLSDVANGHL